MFSSKCKLALRAILFIALESNDRRKLGLKEISEYLKIPGPYLAKILQDLVPKQLVSSVKGPNGGFFVKAENMTLPLIKIIEAVDGMSQFEECGLGLSACSDTMPCPLHYELKLNRDHLKSILNTKTINDLVNDIRLKDMILVR